MANKVHLGASILICWFWHGLAVQTRKKVFGLEATTLEQHSGHSTNAAAPIIHFSLDVANRGTISGSFEYSDIDRFTYNTNAAYVPMKNPVINSSYFIDGAALSYIEFISDGRYGRSNFGMDIHHADDEDDGAKVLLIRPLLAGMVGGESPTVEQVISFLNSDIEEFSITNFIRYYQYKESSGEIEALSGSCATGTCTVLEDPHITGFDGAQVSLLAMKTQGSEETYLADKWLVKSGSVSIQAHYEEDEQLQGTFVRAIAIGGHFLKDNIIVVGSLDDKITWNGAPILDNNDSFGSYFKQDNLSVKVTHNEHSRNVANLSDENPGIDIELPLGVSLIVNRLKHHLNVAITMPQQEGGQQGVCGNFNGVSADDSLEFAAKRFELNVPKEESLFAGYTFG